MSALGELSVVIPVGPGDETWQDLLKDLAPLPETASVYLVSPNISDELRVEHQKHLQARLNIVTADFSRARQLNTGAKVSAGKFILFLHADSRLPNESLAALDAILQSNDIPSLFYFDLKFSNDGPRLMMLNEIGANARSRLLGIPFGDQGFCIRRDLFEQVGGYDTEVAHGEDHLFVWACRALGIETFRVNAPIFTSARKYRDKGWLRTTTMHAAIVVSQIWSVWRNRISAARRTRHA